MSYEHAYVNTIKTVTKEQVAACANVTESQLRHDDGSIRAMKHNGFLVKVDTEVGRTVFVFFVEFKFNFHFFFLSSFS